LAGKRRDSQNARLTAGLKCAPETSPTAKIPVMTTSPKVSAMPTWVTVPSLTSLVTMAIVPANTRAKVPMYSARHFLSRSVYTGCRFFLLFAAVCGMENRVPGMGVIFITRGVGALRSCGWRSCGRRIGVSGVGAHPPHPLARFGSWRSASAIYQIDGNLSVFLFC